MEKPKEESTRSLSAHLTLQDTLPYPQRHNTLGILK